MIAELTPTYYFAIGVWEPKIGRVVTYTLESESYSAARATAKRLWPIGIEYVSMLEDAS